MTFGMGRHIIFIVSVNCYAPFVRHIGEHEEHSQILTPYKLFFFTPIIADTLESEHISYTTLLRKKTDHKKFVRLVIN